MPYFLRYGRPSHERAHPHTAWREGFSLLFARFRRSVALVALLICAGAALGVGARYLTPSSFVATSQLLFNPRGLKVFNNELTSGSYDAYYAINFVESQMAVLQSESVLTRVLDRTCASPDAAAARNPIPGYCLQASAAGGRARALAELQKLIVVRRAERSFVVDIQTRASTPEAAARLGVEIVEAYRTEEAESRAAATRQLTEELNSRLESLRATVKQSEDKAAQFRRDKNLLQIGDRLMVEERLFSATTALSEAQSKYDRAEARMHQVDTALNNRAALGSLGVDADTRALQVLLERRDQLRVEVAPIAARAGARHPALIEGRSKLAQVDGAINVATESLRKAARSDLSRARSERANIERTVADLSAKVAKAHQAKIDLKTIEQETAANRKVLESFEMRAREASEFGRIDSANLRVVSSPTPPTRENPLKGFILWGAIGALAGMILSIGAIAIAELAASVKRPGGRSDPDQDDGDDTVAALRLKAEAFARYRYG